MTEEKDQYEHARQNALASMASIREMVARLQHAEGCAGDDIEECDIFEDVAPDALEDHAKAWRDPATGCDWDEYHDSERAREAIEEDALSIQVRSDWHSPSEAGEDEEFEILLTTGGPALRIVGDFDRYHQPEHPRLEMQDWFVPWQEVVLDSEDYAALRAYCQVFYFGD